MERIQLTAIFFGYVQGVCFRAAVCDHAKMMHVVGWVRNCADGSVEMLAQGTQEQLDALLTAIHQKPGYGRVDRVKTSFQPVTEPFTEFSVRR